jgi:hypothetical protein
MREHHDLQPHFVERERLERELGQAAIIECRHRQHAHVEDRIRDDKDTAKAEPKRLRYQLLHVAARLAFSGRRAKLHLQDTWPWTEQLLAAFQKLKTLAPITA